MADQTFLHWPFFEERHRQLAGELETWARDKLGKAHDHSSVDDACRSLVRTLGDGGWLNHAAADDGRLDWNWICFGPGGPVVLSDCPAQKCSPLAPLDSRITTYWIEPSAFENTWSMRNR